MEGFDDESHVIHFLNNIKEFKDFKIGYKEEGCNYTKCEDMTNRNPKNSVALERLFDRHDATKRKEVEKIDLGEFIEVIIGTSHDFKVVKIGKGTSDEERKK